MLLVSLPDTDKEEGLRNSTSRLVGGAKSSLTPDTGDRCEQRRVIKSNDFFYIFK